MQQGQCYLNHNEFDYAIETFSKAILLEPGYAETYFYRGLTFFMKRDYRRAIEDFTNVIQLNPENAIAYTNRGVMRLHLQEWEKAKTDLITAKNMGKDITVVFNIFYPNIADFEQKHNVKLPEDIAAMLTPPPAWH